MRWIPLLTLAAALLGPLALDVGADPEPAAEADVALDYKVWRNWKIDLPAEQMRKVSGAFDFRAVGGEVFGVEVAGSALAVDTDADGTMDAKVEGDSGFLRLRSGDFEYALRLVSAGAGWMWAASGGRVGKIGDVRVTLIDQDGNGSYADYGTDAMIVGSSKNAAFLSRVVNVGGTLHEIEVERDGTTLTHRPYDGAAGTLDLVSGCETDAKLLAAVVCDEAGDLSFDLARAHEGLRVPAGRYTLHSGKLGLGESVVRVRAGRLAPIEVRAGKIAAPTWGGPLKAEFAYRRSGDEVLFTPETLRYFGRGGEEYFGWKPFGKSPEFQVVDKGAKKEIAKAIFTGC